MCDLRGDQISTPFHMALTDSHHEREPMKMQIKWWWLSELFDTDDDQVMIINLLTGLHSVFHVCLCASAHLQQLKWAAAIFCEYYYDQDSDDGDEEDNDDIGMMINLGNFTFIAFRMH